ncbi:hypothetical protein Q6D67_05110 [Haliea sp. E1-2-M8]|uniref:hypothetical protein n=1 Tax=Haliea sp. E1-2-M8 TaxID=3064706 RepID=UPI0027259C23|nr:hypothetical protein [Haliea sp. E1-2-M8]MDO8861076.1 hypothetical protein [Haliea sp. E1-2-M8]
MNNGFEVPRNPGRYYNSYNPPSINASALVVFRARSTGRSQGPVSGIYTRDMAKEGATINVIADRDTDVPWPNNTCYPTPGPAEGEEEAPVACIADDALATFNEFPSFPRIALTRNAVASRGNHPPVWTYPVPAQLAADEEGEEKTTRAGTSGAYVNLDAGQPGSPLVTGASLLGEVPAFADIFAVPGVDPATKFDVFPGAPAITDAGVVAFKGNFTNGAGKTGVFYRQIMAEEAGGSAAVELVANSDTLVPNPGNCVAGTTFGSTAPPSAAGGQMVFVGFDNEDDPTCGGVYMAPLLPGSSLSTLVGIEEAVPGQSGETFVQLGEGLSYDGRFVSFWGAWGEEIRTVRLYCPQEGNRDRRDFCNNIGQFDPVTGTAPGDSLSVCDDTSDSSDLCYQEKQVPVNQGFFVYDTTGKGRLRMVANAGADGEYDDFLYWNYSGAPPGVSDGDAEPPRWRSAAFQAVSGRGGANFRIAFLARNGQTNAENVYENTVDGIYLGEVLGATAPAITPLVRTGMDGNVLDPEAVLNEGGELVPLPITSLALERDAFRGGWLAISASMGVEEAGWAGIYVTRMQPPPGN